MEQKPFLTRHLHDAHENYFEHLAFTLKFSLTLMAVAFVALVHGLLPFLCTHTASNMLCKLMDEVKARKALCESKNCPADNP